MCLGLRWLRGNDNDSIGREDDRRGVVGPAGAQLPDIGRSFDRRSRRPRLAHQLPAERKAIELLLPTHGTLDVIKCCRADVVTHLGQASRPS